MRDGARDGGELKALALVAALGAALHGQVIRTVPTTWCG